MSDFSIQGEVIINDEASSQLEQIGGNTNSLIQSFQQAADGSYTLDTNMGNLGDSFEKASNQADEINKSYGYLDNSTKKVTGSTKDLVIGFSGVATSAFSLYNVYDRVADMQLNVDRANLKVGSSTNSLVDAQKRLVDLQKKQTPDINKIADAQRNLTIVQMQYDNVMSDADSSELSRLQVNDRLINAKQKLTDAQNGNVASAEELEAAQNDVALAQERLDVATQNAKQTQDNMNEAMIQSALQVIPTCITMVDSLSKLWKNFPDMTKMLTNLSTSIQSVGTKALTASLYVGAFVGGFLLGYTIISQFGDSLGPVGRALMVLVPAIIAVAAAVWMMQSAWTLGGALVMLAASGIAIGAMVANLQSYGGALGSPINYSESNSAAEYLGLANGGIVTHPTLALIGESGPEAVIPLNDSHMQNVTVYNTITIGNISSEVDLEQVTDATSKGITEALERRN